MPPTATDRPSLPKALRRDSLWTLALLAITAFAWSSELPGSLLVLVTGPATIIFAISALTNARGVEAAASIRMWLWIAMGVGAMSLLAGVSLILLRGPIEERQACNARAITETAKNECEAQFEKDSAELVERYRNYGTVKKP